MERPPFRDPNDPSPGESIFRDVSRFSTAGADFEPFAPTRFGLDNSQNLTVIVPVHNGARTILNLLDSLSSNRVFPREVIVVENGSTDGTARLLSEWAASHPDFPLALLSESVRSRSRARNRGIERARTPFVAFLDADCVVEEDWVLRCSELLQEEWDGVGGSVRACSPETRSQQVLSIVHDDHVIDGVDFIPAGRLEVLNARLETNNFLVRIEAMRSVQGIP